MKLPIVAAAAALVGAVVGIGTGVGMRFLTQAAPPPGEIATAGAPHAATEKERVAKSSAKAPDKKKKAKDHAAMDETLNSSDQHGSSGPAPNYFKFSRQFVAPIVTDGEPRAMMVLDVVIELSPEADEGLYASEPSMRDAVLRALLAQSGEGELQSMLANPELLESTRAAILENVRDVVGDEARSVLLMDVAYQPF